jgi:hypothetical protein
MLRFASAKQRTENGIKNLYFTERGIYHIRRFTRYVYQIYMYIKNKRFATVYRMILVAACIAGIIMNIAVFNRANVLLYYTLQSNIVMLLFSAFLLISPRRKVLPAIKGMIIAGIIMTFLEYHFILRPMMFQMGAAYTLSPANTLAHYVMQLMTIADWLLFDEKGQFKKTDPLKWTALPLAYFAFALIRAQFGSFPGQEGRFPYFFIDIDKYGWGQVSFNVLLISVGFVLMGYCIISVDWVLERLSTRRKSSG